MADEIGFRCSYRYRIYPTEEQIEYFNKNFEACRFVYNHYLRARIDAYEATKKTLKKPRIVPGTENDKKPQWERDDKGKVVYEEVENENYDPNAKPLSRFDNSKDLTSFKKSCINEDGVHFLQEVDAIALGYAIANLDAAYQNFFRRVKKGQAEGFPQFKRPGSVRKFKVRFKKLDKIRFPKQGSKYGSIVVPKIGPVKAIIHRLPEGTPVSLTIEHTSSGKWFATLNVKEVDKQPLEPLNDVIGVTTGISEWLVTSDGEVFDNPRRRDAIQKQLAKAQRVLSRRQGARKGEIPSKRYKKQQLKVARLNAKLAQQRQDDTHKLTHALISEHGTIISRDMAVKDMQSKQNNTFQPCVHRDINRKLADANLPEINRQLAYKAQWTGRTYIEVPSGTPTAQTCSKCGYKNTVLAKDLRATWTCPECGTKHNRKYNGAVNVLEAGLDILENKAK